MKENTYWPEVTSDDLVPGESYLYVELRDTNFVDEWQGNHYSSCDIATRIRIFQGITPEGKARFIEQRTQDEIVGADDDWMYYDPRTVDVDILMSGDVVEGTFPIPEKNGELTRLLERFIPDMVGKIRSLERQLGGMHALYLKHQEEG